MEELPHAVAHVMEAMKEAIAKTSKARGFGIFTGGSILGMGKINLIVGVYRAPL